MTAKRRGSHPRKSTKKKKKSSIPKSRGKGSSFVKEITQRFKGRGFQNTDIKVYPKNYTDKKGRLRHDGAETIHKRYNADADPTAISSWLDRKGNRGRIANLTLKYVDKNGEIQYRSTSHTFTNEPETLLKDWYRLLNTYNVSKEVSSVEDVEIDVWDDIESWGEDATSVENTVVVGGGKISKKPKPKTRKRSRKPIKHVETWSNVETKVTVFRDSSGRFTKRPKGK